MSELASRARRTLETTKRIGGGNGHRFSGADRRSGQDDLDSGERQHDGGHGDGHGGGQGRSQTSSLDSLITNYIAISSTLRAQLHVTQLRIATRMKMNATTSSSTTTSDGNYNAVSVQAAHDAIAATREHLENVDKDLPAVHTHLAEMGFLNMSSHSSSSSSSSSSSHRSTLSSSSSSYSTIDNARLFHPREDDQHNYGHRSEGLVSSQSSPWLPQLDPSKKRDRGNDTSRSSGPALGYGYGGGGGRNASFQRGGGGDRRGDAEEDEYAQLFLRNERREERFGDQRRQNKNSVVVYGSGGGRGLTRKNRQTNSQPALQPAPRESLVNKSKSSSRSSKSSSSKMTDSGSGTVMRKKKTKKNRSSKKKKKSEKKLEMKDTREDLNGGGRNGRDERRDMRTSMDARDEDVDFEEQQ